MSGTVLLVDKVPRWGQLVIALLYGLLVVLASAWLKRYGPWAWLWRHLTYGYRPKPGAIPE